MISKLSMLVANAFNATYILLMFLPFFFMHPLLCVSVCVLYLLHKFVI